MLKLLNNLSVKYFGNLLIITSLNVFLIVWWNVDGLWSCCEFCWLIIIDGDKVFWHRHDLWKWESIVFARNGNELTQDCLWPIQTTNQVASSSRCYLIWALCHSSLEIPINTVVAFLPNWQTPPQTINQLPQ
jgi:hypothetical protein